VRLGLPLVLLAGCGCGGGGGGGGGDDAAPCAADHDHTGDGTYYDATGAGACSFDPSPDDLMVAAANPTDFAGSAACGACAAIDGPNGSVTVRIVDLCPGCAAGDLDLSREAFARIAALAAGRVTITWRFGPCQVSGPLRYHFKDGSNPYWTALQVRNHRHAIAGLEARPAGGQWQAVPRESYNYFVAAGGLGPGPIGVRVTDVHGHQVEDDAIPPGDDTEVAGAAQLPACE